MNEILSSLIAFVGFLIVFSMLIQSVQEALNNLFKLKSGVREQFFITLYKRKAYTLSTLPPPFPANKSFVDHHPIVNWPNL